jgi:hypothetical protein
MPARHLVLAAAAVALTLPARAQDAVPRPPRFELTVAGSMVALRTDVRIDGSTNGVEADAERDFGLRRRLASPGARLRWRPARRHEFELGGQLIRRERTIILERDITWNDTTFRAGVAVRAWFDTDNVLFTYRYALRMRERSEIGLGIGAGAILLRTGLDAAIGVSDGTGSAFEGGSVRFRAPAPVISFGGYGRWRLGEAWRLDADLRGFGASVAAVDAGVIDARLAARRYFGRHWAIEASGALEGVRVRVTDETTTTPPESVTARASYRQFVALLGIVFAP